MTERWRDGRWIYEPMWGALRYIPSGMYEDDVAIETFPPDTVTIHRDLIPSLVAALEQNGYITPRLDDRLRAEDLKITHRLLDVIDKQIDRAR